MHQLQQLISPLLVGRVSFLLKFIVSHVNLEIERDFENMEAQHTQLFKEMGAFRGQLSKLNSKIFKTSDPRLTKAGSKFCFRCKSDSHDVKKCTEPRKRKATSKGEVLDVRTDETPTQVESFFGPAVPTETFPVVAPITAQQVVPDPIPIREEPAPAQLEHSTPAEVELAAADVVEEAWVALARKCRAAVLESPQYGNYYVILPRTRMIDRRPWHI